MAEQSWPFGTAKPFAMSTTGAQVVVVDNRAMIIDGVTVEATGNRTLDLTTDTEIKAGAKLHVKHKTNAAQTLTFGIGITAPVITGVAGKTFTQAFTYDGTTFLPDGAAVQID